MKSDSDIKIINVVGARPNFMKIAPLVREMRKHPRIKQYLLHTGQHYDVAMSSVFLQQLGLGEPDIYLNVGSGSHAVQTAAVMTGFEKTLEEIRPDLVVVVGDVNSTLACTVTAAKMCIPTAHVEAGLRSRDRRMPEEINRLVTDVLADMLFTPSKDAGMNLIAEGVSAEKIFFVGNVMIDSLIHCLPLVEKSAVMKEHGLRNGKFALLTLHRPSNVDDPETFAKVADILTSVGRRIPLVFPAHPRTALKMKEFGLDLKRARVKIIPPQGYFDFVRLMRDAKFALTDSGGVQEETTWLGVPCLTMRENTERPVTVTIGTNKIVGLDASAIESEVDRILSGKEKKGRIPKFWDGNASKRIVKEIIRCHGK